MLFPCSRYLARVDRLANRGYVGQGTRAGRFTQHRNPTLLITPSVPPRLIPKHAVSI
jgi:DNA-binding transcriptional regulator of glucitol operon